MRILGSAPARVKARAAAKISLRARPAARRAPRRLRLPRPDAVDDRGPLRGAGERPLRDRPVRAGDGRGPPLPLQRGRGGDVTGATSLLHTCVLALAHAAGARGEGLVAFAVLLGAALYLASIPLAARDRLAARGAARGTARGGARRPLGARSSGATSTAPTSRSSCSSPCCCSIAGSRTGRAAPRAGVALAGALLALARPEGLPIGLAIAVAGRWRAPASRVERLWLWLPVAAGLAVMAVQRALHRLVAPDLGRREVAVAELRPGRDARRGDQVRRRRAARAAARALPARVGDRLRPRRGLLLLSAAGAPAGSAGRGPAGRPVRGPRTAVARARRCSCSRSPGPTSSWASTSIAT